MRHSTITLSMDRYGHVFKSDEAAALAKLPDLHTRSGKDAARATGDCPEDDGFSVDDRKASQARERSTAWSRRALIRDDLHCPFFEGVDSPLARADSSGECDNSAVNRGVPQEPAESPGISWNNR